MTINLEDYIGKTVEVELRNGNVITGHKIELTQTYSYYRYAIGSYLYYFNQNGRKDSNGNCDIIKIKEIQETPTEPKTMSNVIRSKIDVFTTEDERVELTTDDGIFLTTYDKGVRQDLSIGNRDLAISVARAILEAYS